MASSDDEADTQPLSVSNYHFVDDKDAPVSFSILPIQWSESESVEGKKEKVFLHGNADNGLQKIFLQVVAWRFDLSNVKPEMSVLAKDKRWIKLQKPRKSYEEIVRSVLITVYFMHYVRKNLEALGKSVWDSLSKNKDFSHYEVKPSHNDLLNHMGLMGEAAARDAVLAKSKLLLMVMEDKDRMSIKKLSDEEVKELARPGFIIADDIDNDAIDETVVEEESDEEDELFDSVCSFCDNGGELLCCEGKCMRSFHANEEDGEESSCASLGFSRKEVEEIQNFYCKNCEHNKHQCFACGELGCSDKFAGAEVFKCASATCGFFYHPQCVAKLLHLVISDAPTELVTNIAKGEPFTCPAHYCRICKEMENKNEHELHFAVCRRCPKSYHRKCLPRKVAFEDIVEEGIVARAWEDLLPNNRILIYCLKHEIDDELGTPIRDHIKFPYVKQKAKPATKEVINNNNAKLDDLHVKRTSAKLPKLSGKMSFGKVGIENPGKILGSIIPRNKANEASRRLLNENKRPTLKEAEKSDHEENQPSLGLQLYSHYQKGSKQINSSNHVNNVADNTLSVKRPKKLSSAPPQLDADSERRLLALVKEASSSITLESVIKEHKFVSTHTHSLKNVVEKTITMGKLEGSVEAVRTALRMLDEGHSIRDAEAVCGPDVMNRLFKWKDKLKVYLAPVLYGNRYTSFGRHFTQVEKLEGIVDKLHWYVQNNDMIVDFCCGANDFSRLMKKKLEETGKSCLYKNFDLLPTKNDFNFEMRDWMTVQRKELPLGSQLIMGLNPPFGLKAALANKFIDKALEFEPKLLILIVPPETERLDRKRSRYVLVWEDERFLSGKSFYLPGSVDSNDKQMEQWNVKPPPLYLWSHPDWADKHKLIAQEHGHLFRERDVSKTESFDKEKSSASHSMDDNYVDDTMLDRMLDHDFLKSTNDQDSSFMIGQMEGSSHGNVFRVSQERQDYLTINAENTSWKRKRTEENDGRGPAVTLPAIRQDINGISTPQSGSDMELSDNEVGNNGHTPLEPQSSIVDDRYRHLEPLSSSRVEFGQAYDETHNWPNVADPLPDYGLADLQEHNSGHLGDGTSSLGYRPHLRGDDIYPPGLPRPYLTEDVIQPLGVPRPYVMGADYIRLPGVPMPDPMSSSYLSGRGPAYNQMGSTYSVCGSGSELPYMMNTPAMQMSTPAMQRYAPRLDELNHVKTNSLGPEHPIVDRSTTSEHSAQSGSENVPPGFPGGSPHLYSRQNSSNWFSD